MEKFKNKKYLLIIPIILLIVITLITYFLPESKAQEENQELLLITEEQKEVVANEMIKVDIKGAVQMPGVYELNINSRVIDAIKTSGGFLPNADTSTINLSKILKDENVIIVYTKEEIAKIQEGKVVVKYIEKECVCPKLEENTACIKEEDKIIENETKEETETKIININTASLEELMTLPGIGEAKANEIIAYRNKNKFETTEEIKKISGIGDATYNKLKDLIEV